MSDALGLIAFEKTQQQFLEGLTNPRRQVSAKVAEAINREVKTLVDCAHQIALTILGKNQALLEETAQALLEKETLEGQELRSRLNRVQTPAEVDEWLRTGRLPQGAVLMPGALNGGASKLGVNPI